MTRFREFTRRETKARIEHVCAECRQPIAKGSVYIRNGQQLDAEFSTVARHNDCLIVADRFAGLLTVHHGIRMFLVAGIKACPNILPTIRDSTAVEFPDVALRIAKALQK